MNLIQCKYDFSWVFILYDEIEECCMTCKPCYLLNNRNAWRNISADLGVFNRVFS